MERTSERLLYSLLAFLLAWGIEEQLVRRVVRDLLCQHPLRQTAQASELYSNDVAGGQLPEDSFRVNKLHGQKHPTDLFLLCKQVSKATRLAGREATMQVHKQLA